MELYTWVSDSFEKKLPDGVVKAANDNIYGAFRIQCACANIQWRSFASNKYAAWLFHNKSAFKILIEIMKEAFKREREGKPSIFDWNRFACNVFAQNHVKLEIVEEILNAFKDEFSDAERRIAELVKESRFVERTYGIHMIENPHDPKRVYEMFERIFPGSNIFPKPEGTWTDPKDGKTYETFKIKGGLEVMRVPYGNPITVKEAIDYDVIPFGWRIVSCTEADCARKTGAWYPLDFIDRFLRARYPYHPMVEDSVFLFPTYSRLTCKAELSGIYMSRWNEPQRFEVCDMADLMIERIDLPNFKASLMLCRYIM